MRRLYIVMALVLTIAVGAASSSSGGTRDLSTPYVAREFVKAWTNATVKESTAADVDKALAFCTEDVTYEDPGVNARVSGKAQIREGMIAHLGEYKNARSDTNVVVLNVITGTNVVVLSLRRTEKAPQGNSFVKTTRDSVMSLEFFHDKIKLIREYRTPPSAAGGTGMLE